MKVIWYNTLKCAYQFGSYEEYKLQMAGMPNEILALEKFRDASENTLTKIVAELNKCQLSRLR